MAANTVRILASADLHYNIARSREPAEELARRACRLGGDALLLLGDSAGAHYEPLRQCLGLFEGFAGRKLLVPGNHCLWCLTGENSLDRYERTLPALAAECGFEMLDQAPQLLGEVGIAGSIGWYDYSFREESLGVPLPFYQAKTAPGAAGYYSEHRPLLTEHADALQPAHREIRTRWMDGTHVKLPMSDAAFTERLAGRLAEHLAELSARCERIVVGLHHLPFEALVPRGAPPKWAFATAFLGSRRLGEVILSFPKVTHVLCGHSHRHVEKRLAGVLAIEVGSTYTHKRLEVLEL